MLQHSQLSELLPFAYHLYKKSVLTPWTNLLLQTKKNKLQVAHEIKLPEHREDKIFNFPKKGIKKKTEKKLARRCDLFSYPKKPLLSSSRIKGLINIVITCYMRDIHSNPLWCSTWKTCTKLTAQKKVNTTPVTIKTKTKSQSVLVKANPILKDIPPLSLVQLHFFRESKQQKPLSFWNVLMYFVSFYWFNLENKLRMEPKR